MSLPDDGDRSPFTILENPDRDEIQFLDERIDEFNLSTTGITDVRLLTIIVREGEEIVAGLYGWTWGTCCEVKTLWVHERLRGRRLGTRLMGAAEAEARRRGASQIVLSTHSFQAPAFYERLGFAPVGYVEDYPIGHQSIFLRKRLE